MDKFVHAQNFPKNKDFLRKPLRWAISFEPKAISFWFHFYFEDTSPVFNNQ